MYKEYLIIFTPKVYCIMLSENMIIIIIRRSRNTPPPDRAITSNSYEKVTKLRSLYGGHRLG